MKTNFKLRLRTFCISILMLIVLFLKPNGLISQEISTVGEVYDYEVNDIFHYYLNAGNINGYSGMWSITNLKILDKYYSANNATVHYVRNVAYKAFYYPDPLLIQQFYVDTVSYSNLDNPIHNGFVDSVYTDPDLYNGRKINFIDFLNKNNVSTMKYVNGCGVASVYFYSWESQSEHSDELVYFKKGEEEWGTQMIIVSVENLELIDRISMFPNPAKTTLKIVTDLDDIEEGAVFSLNGIKMKSFKLNSKQTTLNISDLKPGLYLVQFITNDNAISKKLIIQ